jgi:acrylyl-CoA reductase (NADPH)
MDLAMTVAPFILRGVSLLGVDSVMCPMEQREEAWRRLAAEMDRDKLTRITETVPLHAVIEATTRFTSGGRKGRTVVAV